jgi:hypothetical protein
MNFFNFYASQIEYQRGWNPKHIQTLGWIFFQVIPKNIIFLILNEYLKTSQIRKLGKLIKILTLCHFLILLIKNSIWEFEKELVKTILNT